MSSLLGAEVTDAVKVPLLIGAIVHGVAAVSFSIALWLCTTTHRHKVVAKRIAVQNVLIPAFFAESINFAAYLGNYFGQQIISRSDSVPVNIQPHLAAIFTYAFVSKAFLGYLMHDSSWSHYGWMPASFGAALFLYATLIGDTSRTIQFVLGWGCIGWAIHAFWVYSRRGRSNMPANFLLVWLMVFWNVGYVIPTLLGHEYLQAITYLVQTWWLVMLGSVAGQLIPLIVMFANLFNFGQSQLFATSSAFASRCPDVGVPGDCSPEYACIGMGEEKTSLEVVRSVASNDDMPLIQASMNAFKRKKSGTSSAGRSEYA